MFSMKRPFHKGTKDKENEFAVSQVCSVSSVECNRINIFWLNTIIYQKMVNNVLTLHF